MGCLCSGEDSSLDDHQSTFELVEGSSGEIEVCSRNRSLTDVRALIVFIFLLAGFGFLVIYAITTGDPNRIISGMDYCANVCGHNNPPLTQNFTSINCKAEDMRNRPYLLTEFDSELNKYKTCVSECESPYEIIILNRCFPETVANSSSFILKALNFDHTFFQNVAEDLNAARFEILYLLLIALVVSLCILIAFRYTIRYVVRLVLIGSVVAILGGTIYLWREYFSERNQVTTGEISEDDSNLQSYLTYSIIMTIVSVISILIIFVMRKRIDLVVRLFTESGKAISSMPLLLLQPILTYFIVGVSIAAWIYCFLYIESAGELHIDVNDHLKYKKDAVHVARWYNILIFCIMFEFYLGCQHMVVAGAVSRWYFTRDKKQLSQPMMRSGFCLVRFHLGTVAFGAMVIGFVRFTRFVCDKVQKTLKKYSDNDCSKGILWFCQDDLWCSKCALRFLIRNAYIETAIHGCNFRTGGRKAFKVISDNMAKVAAINSVGDFVLFLGKVLVVALTVVAGVYLIQEKKGLHYPWIVISIGGVFAFIISHCFISIYEVIIDTIFICYCEDRARNDGITRPYFMGHGLEEFLENKKQVLENLYDQVADSSLNLPNFVNQTNN